MSDSVPTPAARCQRCGVAMSPDAPAGLCPACLLVVAYHEPASDVSSEAVTMLPPTRASGPTSGADASLRPGQEFGPYRIVRLLGRGGMGEVYEADQREHGRRVALKVLSQRLTDRDDRARFLREGQLAASISHPNSVYIFGSEDIAGTLVIAMELLAGGTLKDRVREQGPLTSAAAVDAILQVIAGLDAAHAGGILHRDVKPANCFTARDGTVKVGDFGLSIPTQARDVTEFTRTGTFRGTPQFSAPEQIKGDRLDVRADIYSVGATLYYLLTGRPPFDDIDLMALLTRIATEVPRSPREVQPSVPRGLAEIVLRCLAKERASRPATYAALNEALRPFGSTELTAAPLGSRFAAGVVDHVLLLLFTTVIFGPTVISRDLTANAWSALPTALFIGTYFTLSEGLTGASVGKWILGLRVTDDEGGRPGLVRASVRSAVFVLAARGPLLIPSSVWIRELTLAERLDPNTIGLRAILSFLSVLLQFAPLALFLTARARHGFAGIHELASGTRVTAHAREARAGVSSNVLSVHTSTGPTRTDAAGLTTRGPFLLLESSGSTASAPSLGFDPALKRRVWIREAPVGTPLSDAARRDLARIGRLRWLAGQEKPNGTWEAFEAPRGTPLLSLAATRQPWRAVRQWLADLAEELVLCERDGHVPVLGLDRVWITTEGRAMLLDFPAPGTAPHDTAAVIADTDITSPPAQVFLGSVAWTALLGRVQGVEDALPITRPPLPLSGTVLLRALREPCAERLQDLLDLCKLALETPSDVTRRSRGFLPALIAAVLCAIGISASVVSNRATASQALFNSLVAIERLRRLGALESDPERRALEIHTAGSYTLSGRLVPGPLRQLADEIAARHPAVSDAELLAARTQLGRDRLESLNGPGLVPGMDSNQQALLNSLVAIEQRRRLGAPEFDPEQRALEIYIAGSYAPLSERTSSFIGALRPFRQLANDIAARHPAVSDAELVVASRQLGRDRLDRLHRQDLSENAPRFVAALALLLLPVIVGFGYLSLLLAFVFRGGLNLRLFRLALVDATGAEVTRWRALWRAALAWGPLIGLQPLADQAIIVLNVRSTDSWTMVAALCLVVTAVGICWAIVVPARGLHDRIAGTWLVPR